MICDDYCCYVPGVVCVADMVMCVVVNMVVIGIDVIAVVVVWLHIMLIL